jgi:hypothetical protein
MVKRMPKAQPENRPSNCQGCESLTLKIAQFEQ